MEGKTDKTLDCSIASSLQFFSCRFWWVSICPFRSTYSPLFLFDGVESFNLNLMSWGG